MPQKVVPVATMRKISSVRTKGGGVPSVINIILGVTVMTWTVAGQGT